MTVFENDFITTVFKPFDTNRFRAWDKKRNTTEKEMQS